LTICLLGVVFGAMFFAGCSKQQQSNQQEEVQRNLEFLSSDGLIRVMTFNIRVDGILDSVRGIGWGHRKEMALDTITNNFADVIGLQEVTSTRISELEKVLPAYDYYWAGRTDGKEKGESCPIFYLRDRFSLKDSGTFWFSNKPNKPNSIGWGNIVPRICSWVCLMEKKTNNSFYVYNVHMAPFSQGSREKSVRLLAKHISCLKTQNPFFVIGDFNMSLNPIMENFQEINSQTSYPRIVDSWRSAHPYKSFSEVGKGTCHKFTGKTSDLRIDHILVSENTRAYRVFIDRNNVNGHYPSDHFPVVSEIRLGRTSDLVAIFGGKDFKNIQ